MSFLILPGRYLNILDGCNSITASDPEAGYDEENVANNVPSHPFRFDDAGTDDNLVADLDRLIYGDFENWAVDTQPDGWEATGTVSKDAVVVHGGTYSCELAAEAEVKRIVWVPSGWDMDVESWLYGDGTYQMYAYLQNLYTGYWLNASAEWQSAKVIFGGRSAASWGAASRTFTVESYSTCGYQHLVPLEISFVHQTGGSGGYVDDVALWPHWDFASIHGHNIPPSITLRVQSDDNSGMSSPTNQVAFTVIQPSFFGLPAATVTERYARLLLDGTVHQEKSAYVGEWVLGQYKTLTKTFRYGVDYLRVMPINPASSISRTPRSDWSHRGLNLDFRNTDTALTTMYEMLDRARGGADPFVVVPVDTESTVMFGYFPTTLSVNRIFTDHQGYQLEFREMAFPLSF
jgi:hypothetical protein